MLFKIIFCILLEMNTKYADRITPTIKKELWKRHFNDDNDGTCKICNMVINKNIFTWKYIFPKARGGRNNILNLLPVCSVCDKKYNNVGDEFNLIIFLKNKHNIIVELDNEYQHYQDMIIYMYNNAYNTGTFLKYTKPDRCQAILPVITYLISNNLYNPKWTFKEYKDFINVSPERKDTDRRLILFDTTINNIIYSKINLHYELLGSSEKDCLMEVSYSIERKSTGYLGGCCLNGWFSFNRRGFCKHPYFKEVDTFIQPHQHLIFY